MLRDVQDDLDALRALLDEAMKPSYALVPVTPEQQKAAELRALLGPQKIEMLRASLKRANAAPETIRRKGDTKREMVRGFWHHAAARLSMEEARAVPGESIAKCKPGMTDSVACWPRSPEDEGWVRTIVPQAVAKYGWTEEFAFQRAREKLDEHYAYTPIGRHVRVLDKSIIPEVTKTINALKSAGFGGISDRRVHQIAREAGLTKVRRNTKRQRRTRC